MIPSKQDFNSLFAQFYNTLSQIDCKNSYDFELVLKTYYTALSAPDLFSSAEILDYISRSENFQTFRKTINFENTAITFYWDVNRLAKLVEKEKLLPVPFAVTDAYSTVDPKNIDPSRFPHLSEDPIFIGMVPFTFPSYLVLDGNHRTTKALRDGKSTLSAYIFEPSLHVSALYPGFQELFKIICNVSIIVQYMMRFENFSSDELGAALFDV